MINDNVRTHQTDKKLIQAFADLFDAIGPETPEEIDAVLSEEGYDPDEVGLRMQEFAEKSLHDAKED